MRYTKNETRARSVGCYDDKPAVLFFIGPGIDANGYDDRPDNISSFLMPSML